MLEMTRECSRHGTSTFIIEGRGYYRCKQCRQDGVAEHRRAVELILVAEAGGRCLLCGYDACPAALEFHHVDPSTKRHGIAGNGISRSMAILRAEAEKCVLLCSNCHAEVESGTRTLALK